MLPPTASAGRTSGPAERDLVTTSRARHNPLPCGSQWFRPGSERSPRRRSDPRRKTRTLWGRGPARSTCTCLAP